jgi:hypothetical protein
MKEVLISMIGGKPSITPVDMDGVTHHALGGFGKIEAVLVNYGAITAHITDGNICIRGHRLIINTDLVQGRLMCLVVTVKDTSGEE